jgi:hypothetical protein
VSIALWLRRRRGGRRPTQQLADPTPCTRWTVQDLVKSLVGSTDYLLGATEAVVIARSAPATVNDDATPQDRLLAAMGRQP